MYILLLHQFYIAPLRCSLLRSAYIHMYTYNLYMGPTYKQYTRTYINFNMGLHWLHRKIGLHTMQANAYNIGKSSVFLLIGAFADFDAVAHRMQSHPSISCDRNLIVSSDDNCSLALHPIPRLDI